MDQILLPKDREFRYFKFTYPIKSYISVRQVLGLDTKLSQFNAFSGFWNSGSLLNLASASSGFKLSSTLKYLKIDQLLLSESSEFVNLTSLTLCLSRLGNCITCKRTQVKPSFYYKNLKSLKKVSSLTPAKIEKHLEAEVFQDRREVKSIYDLLLRPSRGQVFPSKIIKNTNIYLSCSAF